MKESILPANGVAGHDALGSAIILGIGVADAFLGRNVDVEIPFQPGEAAGFMDATQGGRGIAEIIFRAGVVGEKEGGGVDQVAALLDDLVESVGNLVGVLHVLEDRHHDHGVEGIRILLGQLLDIPVEERDWPTALVSAFADGQGVDFLRVHQVRPTLQALRLMASLTDFGMRRGGKLEF